MSNGKLVRHEHIALDRLAPHPRNEEIYGDPRFSQDFDAFVQDVKENGIHPLIVAEDMTIIGGHRRYYAALQLSMVDVDAAIFHYETEMDKLAALIADNNVRIKSNWQLANEAAVLMEIAGQRAKERQGTRTDIGEPVHTSSNGRATDEVGEQLGVSGRTVSDMLTVKEVVDQLEDVGLFKEAGELKTMIDKSVKAAVQAAKEYKEPSPPRHKSKEASKTTFNQTNSNVEWALWTWNPVTGCLHNCPYCYARDIANRYYPQGFEPVFHEQRLSAPRNTKVPDLTQVDDPVRRIGLRNVFTCSMADLFGKWVPAEWIHAVLEQVVENPQWNFLFLTKFPIRMAEFEFPPNTWIGTTVDSQHAALRAEKAFRKIRKGGYQGVAWLSCEPMMERLTFSSLDMFDWLVMGGASKSTQTPAFAPPIEWWYPLWQQAESIGIPVYMKTNLIQQEGRPIAFDGRVRQYPLMGATP